MCPGGDPLKANKGAKNINKLNAELMEIRAKISSYKEKINSLELKKCLVENLIGRNKYL